MLLSGLLADEESGPFLQSRGPSAAGLTCALVPVRDSRPAPGPFQVGGLPLWTPLLDVGPF